MTRTTITTTTPDAEGSRAGAAQHEEPLPAAIVLMGVSGTGKSTVARLLARTLGWEFVEGDKLHAPENIAKMSRGEPLTDDDRHSWLAAISAQLGAAGQAGRRIVITCSALKFEYRRDYLRAHPDVWIFMLDAPEPVLFERLQRRLESREHFFPPELLHSQEITLEWPRRQEGIIVIDAEQSPQRAVYAIQLNLCRRPEL